MSNTKPIYLHYHLKITHLKKYQLCMTQKTSTHQLPYYKQKISEHQNKDITTLVKLCRHNKIEN